MLQRGCSYGAIQSNLFTPYKEDAPTEQFNQIFFTPYKEDAPTEQFNQIFFTLLQRGCSYEAMQSFFFTASIPNFFLPHRGNHFVAQIVNVFYRSIGAAYHSL